MEGEGGEFIRSVLFSLRGKLILRFPRKPTATGWKRMGVGGGGGGGEEVEY